jgi:hypothetical protein
VERRPSILLPQIERTLDGADLDCSNATGRLRSRFGPSATTKTSMIE